MINAVLGRGSPARNRVVMRLVEETFRRVVDRQALDGLAILAMKIARANVEMFEAGQPRTLTFVEFQFGDDDAGRFARALDVSPATRRWLAMRHPQSGGHVRGLCRSHVEYARGDESGRADASPMDDRSVSLSLNSTDALRDAQNGRRPEPRLPSRRLGTRATLRRPPSSCGVPGQIAGDAEQRDERRGRVLDGVSRTGRLLPLHTGDREV